MRATKRLSTLVMFTLLGAPAMAWAAPVYLVSTVGNIGASQTSSPQGLNNTGQVVGYAPNGSTSAFVATVGGMTSLHPPGAAASEAHGINNGGIVVGQVTTGTKDRAVTWSGGVVTDAGSLGDANTSSYGYGINDSGRVVGASYLAGAGGVFHAFESGGGGSVVDLGTLGGANSFGRGINAAGSAAGYSNFGAGFAYHAFRYLSGGSMQDLSTFGGTYSDAYGINDSGAIVGYAQTSGDVFNRAFVDAGGGLVDIGSLAGTNSLAFGINNAGMVVGSSDYLGGGGNQHAFLYSGGIMKDLNTLIDPALGWTLTYAADINENNQIAAEGCKDGVCRSLLLTLAVTPPDPTDPRDVPEPASFSAVVAALGLAGVLRRRKKRAQG